MLLKFAMFSHWSLLSVGILHPEDAQIAKSIGVDGIIVSNHGGRQIDGAPASIDVLQRIKTTVGPGFPVGYNLNVTFNN